MKNDRGSKLLILLICIFFFNTLDAKESDYAWSASINKKSAYINEAIYLKYICKFKDRGELYVVDFNPKSTDKFEIISLSQTHKIKDNKRTQVFEYVVFAKQAGKLEFNFNLRMKKTNKDSIENTVLGRDNDQFEEYSIKEIKQKQLSIDIKDSNDSLVGSFSLRVKKDEPKVKAYQPYHLSIMIDGIGDFNALGELDFSNVDAKVFAAKVQRKYRLTKDGYKGTWSQKFAFVSDKSFVIPNIDIKYLGISKLKEKILTTGKIEVEVLPAYKQEELLDEVEDESFKINIEFIYYILTFIAGYLLAKLRLKLSQGKSKDIDLFTKKVNDAKTLDELHILLVLENVNKYKEIITDIENNKLDTLAKVKNLLKIND